MSAPEFWELWGRVARACPQRLSQHDDVRDARLCGRELADFYSVIELRRRGVLLERFVRKEGE